MSTTTIEHLIAETRGSDGDVVKLTVFADDPGVPIAQAVRSLPISGSDYAWIVTSSLQAPMLLRALDEQPAREALGFLGALYVGALRVNP